jgi:hypothetical protein
MLTLQTLEKYAVSIHQLALAIDERVIALESKERRKTVRPKRAVQQLKPAISRVRKWAFAHRETMDYTEFNLYLEWIEKQAGV